MSSQIVSTAASETATCLHLAYWWRLGAQNEANLALTANARRAEWGLGERPLKVIRHSAGRYRLAGYAEEADPLSWSTPVIVPLGPDPNSLALAAHFASLGPLFSRLEAELVPALSVAAGLIPELAARYGLPYEQPRCALFELTLEVSKDLPPRITWAALVVDDASSSKPAVLAWNYDGTSAGCWIDRADRRTLRAVENLYRSEIRETMVPRFEAIFYRLFEPASGRVREGS
jgi:hypothetical protein